MLTKLLVSLLGLFRGRTAAREAEFLGYEAFCISPTAGRSAAPADAAPDRQRREPAVIPKGAPAKKAA